MSDKSTRFIDMRRRFESVVVERLTQRWPNLFVEGWDDAEAMAIIKDVAATDQLFILADIRKAIGDPEGRLMLSEVVDRIRASGQR